MEVLESTLQKDTEMPLFKSATSDDSIYTNSEKESNDSDEYTYSKGVELLEQLKPKSDKSDVVTSNSLQLNNLIINRDSADNVVRRYSGPIKHVSLQVAKADISNFSELRNNLFLREENETVESHDIGEKIEINDDSSIKPRKSILKNTRKISTSLNDIRSKPISDYRKSAPDNAFAEDTETSGYRSNSSSRHNESSETESDYGYSTITEAATPKRIGLSDHSNLAMTSGVLPDDTWTPLELRTLEDWSDEEIDTEDTSSKLSLSKNLYERRYYLNSLGFMSNFVDSFIINLGSGLGLTQDAINSALTQGASIYCDAMRNGSKIGYEIFPALIAAWPNAANQWIIRERKIIQNPRTNFSYQWPTRYMVNKAIGFGCLLVPVGFRPKRGLNPEQTLQWRIIFPAAERYLESCLAHSHMRCYLFALALHKTFMENETSKIGIDASHIRNHLFWQCEDNYAKWPEDRLGESLRLFLKSFYIHFGQSRFPNYFIENCNEFKSIPKPLLLKLQRRLADILEAPVMHVLYAIEKLKYTKRDFYPPLKCHRLYDILTCKNPLRIINPNLPLVTHSYSESSDSEDEVQINFWDKAKAQDKHYQWKKERQRQMQARRKAQMNIKKQKSSVNQDKEINKNVSQP